MSRVLPLSSWGAGQRGALLLGGLSRDRSVSQEGAGLNSEHLTERSREPKVQPLNRAIDASQPIDSLIGDAQSLHGLGDLIGGHLGGFQQLRKAHTHLRERYATTAPCDSNDIVSIMLGAEQEPKS